ncbi:MAG: prenyltransferase/squalene oxidase repeat-containing protein [Chthoniobacteraceae bacterium]|nr:prenyltransferase/squalene oxidase repeat-containing protein [Chthoniobacteraceae bacterium]
MVPGSGTKQSLSALLRAFLRRRGPLRGALIRTARRAPELLGSGSTDLVRAFLRRSQTSEGGFAGRDGLADLYYTVFGMQAALALDAPLAIEPLRAYLQGFGGGEQLGFVSLCCLARGRALLRDAHAPLPPTPGRELAARIAAFRAGDGGFHSTPNSPHGTASAAFLAAGAWEDLRQRMPDAKRLAQSVKALATSDGGWASERGVPLGSTHAIAAAAAVPGVLASRADAEAAGRWLLARAHPLGGFTASPLAPMPDLLSTATALQTLAALGIPLEPVREPCLGFLDSLWTNAGGFHGHWEDDVLDVEYTFYGLLALGSLV